MLIFEQIMNIFGILADILAPIGDPIGFTTGDWFFIIYTIIWIVIVILVKKKSSPY
jgi:hypothetical protein